LDVLFHIATTTKKQVHAAFSAFQVQTVRQSNLDIGSKQHGKENTPFNQNMVALWPYLVLLVECMALVIGPHIMQLAVKQLNGTK